MNKYFQPRNYIRKAKELFIRFHIKHNKNFVLSSHALHHEILFYVDSMREYESRVLSSYSEEPSTVEWIDKFVSPNDTVFDVGANVGAYTLLLAKKIQEAGGKGIVYSFEPESGNFYKLNKNIKLNKLSSHAFPICMAIGNRRGIDAFFLSSTEIGSACHGLYAPKSEGKTFKAKHKQGVVAHSLDSLTNLEEMPFPNHIKIDVDGMEKQIIENGSQTLANPLLQSVIIEINDSLSLGKIEKKIMSFGFKEMKKDVWRDKNNAQIKNVLFARRSP